MQELYHLTLTNYATTMFTDESHKNTRANSHTLRRTFLPCTVILRNLVSTLTLVHRRWLFLLHRTQRHCGVTPIHVLKPKRRIERFSECGAEGVEVDQCVRADSVERQSAGRPIQIHCYSLRNRGGLTNVSHFVIVKDRVTAMRAAHAPWIVTEPETAVSLSSSPSDPSVSHS